jgi:hypothetical protein
MRFVGVDVGIKGAIAILDEKGAIIHIIQMPVIKYQFSKTSKVFSLVNIREIRSAVYPLLAGQKCFIAMERVYTGKGSAKGAITSGINYGRVWSALELSGNSVEVITHPSQWQKPMFKRYAAEGDDTKSFSISAAAKRFGEQSLIPKGSRTPKDGIADALLIAEHLRIRELGV